MQNKISLVRGYERLAKKITNEFMINYLLKTIAHNIQLLIKKTQFPIICR